MEIRELRAFVAVAEDGGMSAAAPRPHISQSALSQTIQSLERQLGVQLLVRDHAGSRPNDAGKGLLAEARALTGHPDPALRAPPRAAARAGGAPSSGPP